MWDEEGFAIVHKNYKKPANQGQGALLVADLDAGSDAVFRSAFQTNVVEQGRVRGVWEFPGRRNWTSAAAVHNGRGCIPAAAWSHVSMRAASVRQHMLQALTAELS